MSVSPCPSDSCMPHQLFQGTTWHSRLLPNVHKFTYPYRYWGINISALADGHALPEVTLPLGHNNAISRRLLKNLPMFSAKQKALQQFCASDYLHALDSQHGTKSADNNSARDTAQPMQALKRRLQQAFISQTGSAPLGEMMGLVVCRNAGVYFSPVNFYLGFNDANNPSHLLAEVSNTPWDKRHYYGFLLTGTDTELTHDKNFHVSPFNPIDQLYHWQVNIKPQGDGLQVRIAINISDERGEVLKTGVKMTGMPMTAQSIQDSLKTNPLMNITSLTRIYWHALKLYAIKKVPYINYDEKLVDSQQAKKPDIKTSGVTTSDIQDKK